MREHPDPEAVLRAHAGLIDRVAHAAEANPALREELRQEIALAVWTAVRRFRGECPLRSFVARIAHNLAAAHATRHLQRRGRELPQEEWLEQIAQEGEQEAELLQAALYAAMRRLPLALRQALSLAFEGFSQAEIAELQGISIVNAGVRVHRARQLLRQEMGMQA